MRAGAELERAFREDRAAALAALTRRTGDLDRAQDAVAEAFASAVVSWERDGVPRCPRAWLITAAWRSALDSIRRDATQGRVRRDVARQVHPAPARPGLSPLDDDLLRLMVMCAHPSLSLEAQIALTLRCVAGLATTAVARLTLTSESAAAQRIVRAKRKLRDAAVPLELPPAGEMADRLVAVRAVVHALFTEGHAPSAGDAGVRPEVCEEAMCFARLLRRMLPDDVETAGLLALITLVHARAPARLSDEGAVTLLPHQDRSRWSSDLIAEGLDLLASARRGRLPGRYWLEAEIAAEHDRAGDDESTNWSRIAALYAALSHLTASGAAEINRAVAIGRAEGPHAGLVVLAPLLTDPSTTSSVALYAAHADLLRRAGYREESASAWSAAAALTRNRPHRELLLAAAEDAGNASDPATAG